MTTTYKSATAFPADTTLTTVYTVPAVTTALIKSASAVAKLKTRVRVFVTDTSASKTTTLYDEQLSVGEEADLSALHDTVLETTDVLKVQTSVASSCEFEFGLDLEA